MKKPFKMLIFLCFLVFIGILCFSALFKISSDSLNLKYMELSISAKKHFGGILINKTSSPVKIMDNLKIIILPPHKTSRDVGIFDADSLIIEKQVLFENQKYSKGLIKFCDVSTLTIYQEGNLIVAKPSLSYKLCKLIEPVGWAPPERFNLLNASNYNLLLSFN